MLAAYSMMVSISSLFALFIGMFIIYNSFAIAVTQRRSEIGILRALGATRGQIRWLFLGESAVTGLIGSLGGLAFGVLIARGIAASIGALISDVYGVAQHADEVVDRARRCSLVALAIGIATSIVAAVDSGAQRGARRSGAGAAEGQVPGAVGRREPAARASLGARCSARVSIACLAVGALAAGVLRRLRRSRSSSRCCSARCCRSALAQALRPLLKWLRPVEGALAADSLIQAPRRTSASVAALMLSLALVVAFAGHGARQLRLDHRLDGDGAEPRSLRPAVAEHRRPHDPLSGGDGAGARGDPRRRARADGARRAHHVPRHAGDGRRGRGQEHRARPRSAPPVAGNADEMYRRAAAGEGLMVSDNLAQLQHLTLGEMLEMPAPNGADPPADRRHRRRLLRSAGHDPDGSQRCSSATGTTIR